MLRCAPALPSSRCPSGLDAQTVGRGAALAEVDTGEGYHEIKKVLSGVFSIGVGLRAPITRKKFEKIGLPFTFCTV